MTVARFKWWDRLAILIFIASMILGIWWNFVPEPLATIFLVLSYVMTLLWIFYNLVIRGHRGCWMIGLAVLLIVWNVVGVFSRLL